MELRNLKVGDVVERYMGGQVAMELIITEVTDDRIICGPWEFDRTYGYEIDEDLGWGAVRGGAIVTGSTIQPKEEHDDRRREEAVDGEDTGAGQAG